MRSILLYLDLLRLQLLARSQYRADFWIGVVAALLRHGVTLATLWLVFRQVPVLGGWNLYQAAFLYSLFALASGLTNLLASGLRVLPWTIRQGELDGLLVLPVSPYVQLLPQFNLPALGDVILALMVLLTAAPAAGIDWTWPAALYTLLAVFCGTGVLLGFMTAVYSLAFWSPYPGLMAGAEELTQLARYPASLYPRWLRALITWLFPVAFAGYYPAAILTGAEPLPGWMAAAAPPAALAALAMGALVWRLGLRRYEGTGS